MSLKPQANYELSISEQDLHKGINEIAPKINSWVRDVSNSSDEPIIALCVLRGGCFFFADLLRAIDSSVQMEFVKFSSYDESTNSQLIDSAISNFNFSFEFKNRIVLIVDDICESGRTLSILSNRLKELGAKDVKTAVMVYRHMPEVKIAPDFFATEVHHLEWLVGMGLDDGGRFRNLSSIYKIKK